MTEKPLVSIIVPIFNGDMWLEECIVSILNQSYRNIELLLIDDGSTDSSKDICMAFAEKDIRILFFVNALKGVSSSRNMGLDKANGEYVIFVDCDDVIKKDYVERLLEAMYDVDLSICGIILEDDTSKQQQIFCVRSMNYSQDEFVINMISAIPFILLSGVGAKCFNRRLIEKENIRFAENISIGEDCLFNIEYYSNCNNIRTIKYSGYIYKRRNKESLTNTVHPEIFVVQTKILRKFLDLYQMNGVNEKYKEKFINIWIEQICGELRVVCRTKKYIDYVKLVRTLLTADFYEINLSIIRDYRKRILMFLVKFQISCIAYLIFRYY